MPMWLVFYRLDAEGSVEVEAESEEAIEQVFSSISERVIFDNASLFTTPDIVEVEPNGDA